MKMTLFRRSLFAVLIILAVFAPMTAWAVDVELIVEPNAPNDGTHFSNIQAAIDHANSILSNPSGTTTTFRVVVEPSTSPYSGPITLITGVPILGRETSRTLIVGNGTAAVITASNVTGVFIKNFTFINAAAAILISGNSTVRVLNNVFDTGTASTAVQVQNSQNSTIINNVFYQTGTAITKDSDITITNNVFFGNGTAISNLNQSAVTNTTYNYYFNNTNTPLNLDIHSIPNQFVAATDPLFVDAANEDFHLQSASTCTNAGNPNFANVFDNTTSAMGAFGGPDADTVPLPVAGLITTATTTSSITLGWSQNNSYLVGGYHVYYGTTSGDLHGTTAAEGPSFVTVSGSATTSQTLSNLVSLAVTTPDPPTILALSPMNNSLLVSWVTSSGASGYKIYYDTAPFSSPTSTTPVVSVPGGSTSSFTLQGLTNLTTYYVAVSATAQTTYFIAVSSFNSPSVSFVPGISYESVLSTEIQFPVGTPLESGISSVLHDFPEGIKPYPNLPNKGCFIATAAYGYYSAPQVQVLREFRDRLLMTNGPGRAFVQWYYRVGPTAASFITDHPSLKPAVRAALLPLLGGAYFLLYTPLPIQMATLFCLVLLTILVIRRRNSLRSGGVS